MGCRRPNPVTVDAEMKTKSPRYFSLPLNDSTRGPQMYRKWKTVTGEESEVKGARTPPESQRQRRRRHVFLHCFLERCPPLHFPSQAPPCGLHFTLSPFWDSLGPRIRRPRRRDGKAACSRTHRPCAAGKVFCLSTLKPTAYFRNRKTSSGPLL